MSDVIEWPNETPCAGCGWPRYCCLCPAADVSKCDECDKLRAELEKLSYFTEPYAKGATGRWLTADEMIHEWAQRAADFDAIEEERDELRAENARIVTELEKLTPGGSEFHNSPNNCLEWIKSRLIVQGALVAERNRLRAENARLDQAMADTAAQLVEATERAQEAEYEASMLADECRALNEQLERLRPKNDDIPF